MANEVSKLIGAMRWFLEEFDPEGDLDDTPVETSDDKPRVDDDSLIEELNSIYTPVMITQQLNEGVRERIMEACSGENVLTEANVIKFDPDTRRSQLISLCAMLLARNAGSADFEAYRNASNVRKTMKLKIQKDYHGAAIQLADRYLRHVTANSTNSTVRSAAEELIEN